jgi:hypothetical protein
VFDDTIWVVLITLSGLMVVAAILLVSSFMVSSAVPWVTLLQWVILHGRRPKPTQGCRANDDDGDSVWNFLLPRGSRVSGFIVVVTQYYLFQDS